MNKQQLLHSIAAVVQQKYLRSWTISQDRYLFLFKELPKEFVQERIHYDNLITKSKQFTKCWLNFSDIKPEVKLNLDELIIWELNLDKWIDVVKLHNIVPNDIKKIIKDQ